MLECRNCGAGAPVDDHFCRQCDRILALGRFGDYFSFFGLPRRLSIDARDLEGRFRELSRKFHPDYYYNAPPAERLASLERSSYLNDGYRVLRDPIARIEHVLALEGLRSAKSDEANAQVPPPLLEEVFALNEELDEIRELQQAGADAAAVHARLEAARQPIERKRAEHQQRIDELSALWDAQEGSPDRRRTLEALREQLLESSYIDNLIRAIEEVEQGKPRALTHEPGAGSGHG